ncbi:hypothetical protein ACE6H2_009930 [Prunus campanulata]
MVLTSVHMAFGSELGHWKLGQSNGKKLPSRKGIIHIIQNLNRELCFPSAIKVSSGATAGHFPLCRNGRKSFD